jgi:outer membrane cobalamin receptor
MKEMVITSTRTAVKMDRVPSRTELISRQGIGESNASTLGTLLTAVPGVVVRDYGSGGAVQTLSMRGMSAEHSLLMIDGIPINNIQTGLSDIRLFPVDMMESIEIVRGGLSSLYGTSAIGGVVNIRTDNPNGGNSVSLKNSIGSFGASGMSVSVHHSFNSLQLNTGIRSERESGNYPVQLLQQGTLQSGTRKNTDFTHKSAYMSVTWDRNRFQRGHALLSITTLDRGTPGPLLTLENQGGGRQTDDVFFAGSSFTSPLSEETEISVSGSVQRSNERYADETGIFRGNNYYRNTLMTFSPSVWMKVSQYLKLLSGLDADYASAEGNALPGFQTRPHAGWFLGGEIESDTMHPAGIAVSLYPSLRLDGYRAMRPVWSSQIGMNAASVVGVVDIILHSTFGNSFRVPTFNELYYSGAGGFGNPQLRREQSVHGDVGMTLQTAIAGPAEIDVTYYSITTNDRILWLPASSPFIWSPVNISRTRSSGFEVEGKWTHHSDFVSLQANYVYIDAKNISGTSRSNPVYGKQLLYVPLETANVSMQFRIPVDHDIIRKIMLRIADSYMGERFTVEDNSGKLPSYHSLNGNIGIDMMFFDVRTSLRYGLNNMTDEVYEIIPRYPMPPRNSMLSLSLQKNY